MLTANTTELLEWGKTEEKAFKSLKDAVAKAPTLGLPNYQTPFALYVNERAGTASGVLVQQLGPRSRPVGYFLKQLDTTARGFPACLRVMAAVEVLIEEAQKVTMGYPMTVKVPHEVNTLLTDTAAKYLTPARHTAYKAIIMSNPEITVEVCSTLNPATLLPDLEWSEAREHLCTEVLEEDLPLRKDLTDVRLENADLELFTDGSSYMVNGKRFTS